MLAAMNNLKSLFRSRIQWTRWISGPKKVSGIYHCLPESLARFVISCRKTLAIIEWILFCCAHKTPRRRFYIFREYGVHPYTKGNSTVGNRKTQQTGFTINTKQAHHRGDNKGFNPHVSHSVCKIIKFMTCYIKTSLQYFCRDEVRFFFLPYFINQGVSQDRNNGVDQNYSKKASDFWHEQASKAYKKSKQKYNLTVGPKCCRILFFSCHDILLSLYLIIPYFTNSNKYCSKSRNLLLFSSPLYKGCYIFPILDKHFSHILFIDSTHIFRIKHP